MSSDHDELFSGLQTVIPRVIYGASGVEDLIRLSGGASQETWAFNVRVGDSTQRLILRRAPHGKKSTGSATSMPLETEAQLVRLAGEGGVKVPHVHHILEPSDQCGAGFIMEFIEGETIARKILRDDLYKDIRPDLARQCGEAVAPIHNLPTDAVEGLRFMDARAEFDQYRASYDAYDYPHPVFELAFKWLEERLPETSEPSIVHGDYRHGNLIIGTDGVRAVLDWELAHLGDPMQDLGWICVNSWRFGELDKPVGGFGTREEMFTGYEAAGGAKVDPARVKYWETFGSLKWGIMCMSMYNAFKIGDPSVERAAIGRRSSEAEIDLLRLITEDH